MPQAIAQHQPPTIKHLCQNARADRVRWNFVPLRDSDTIVTTPYKSGTMWMQTIVALFGKR